ncbi:2-hydroxyacid dehydrogenase [Psychroflexus lacisalsi]|uniref:2-hydroxyacid dehydrogenase n=1 Tax=Psychroflexus lacisalsi TaxID=503928 RepID=A0ABP3VIK6_9FLAO|nr:2-hydroxyacid dehydrogenase [Psychroflexus lacisalsi]MBZ9619709.1 2-hydroxyacid dehydrogenase [Psychroflexus lacisalsi]
MKIAVFSSKPYDRRYFETYNKDYNYELSFFDTNLNAQTSNLTQDFDVVCVFVNDQLGKEVIKALANNGVKLIALRCAGFNNVDLEAAEQYGIKVTRVPAYSPQAVAEHALALILTLNRKTHKAYNRVKEGNFSLDNLIGFNVYNKTVGVIGTGKIGQAFCKIMLGLGCKVLAYDVTPQGALEEAGVTYVTLEELYKGSDIISLHCPLLPATQHLINDKSIAQMKTQVMIINTSRGGLINTEDVVKNLKDRKVGYLGIDVYEQEENVFFEDKSEQIIEDDTLLKLISFPNVLITSHQAFLTSEALTEISKTVFSNIYEFVNNQSLTNEVKQ